MDKYKQGVRGLVNILPVLMLGIVEGKVKKKRSSLIKLLILFIGTSLVMAFSVIAVENKALPIVDNNSPRLEWADYLEMLKDNKRILQYSTVQDSPESVSQYLFMTLVHAYSLIYKAHPDYPEFRPYINHVIDIAGPNPDTTYYFATLDGRNSYRITGYRGNVHMIDFQTGYDFFGFKATSGKALLAMTMDEFSIEDDGHFEILLSNEKPKSYNGNWMPLDERVNYMFVRQVAYHPNEINARMAIENLSKPRSKPYLVDTEKQLKKIIDYVKHNSQSYLRFLDLLDDEKNIYNKFIVPDWSSVGGAKDQVYQHGLYDINESEALILTVKVPDQCKYWNIQTTDLLWQTHDYMNTQSNLNGHVDRADSDGLTRIVLSQKDPGVANWIDLNGKEKGYVLMRWVSCNNETDLVVKKIDFRKLNDFLPENTKRVTAQERRELLRAKSVALQLRRNW